MKSNLWFKNTANQNHYKSVYEKQHGYYDHRSRSEKPKRVRSAFTTEQVNYLEREYKKYPYIGTGHRKEIAASLNISERTVKIWFQNRRMKEKKETIYKEFCDEHTGQEIAKSRLNNMATMQSTNDGSLNALPLLTTDVDNAIAMNNKLLHLEENRMISKDTSLLKNILDLLILGKKYIKVNNNLQAKSNPTNVESQGPISQNSNSLKPKVSPQDLTTKIPPLQTKQKPCTGHAQGISGYFPVVPNFYPQPFVSPGGVLWKPVIMPLVSEAGPNISTNDFN
ncbi:homeotic protein proboscipedia-like, partial [Manduca sexta]|uniref:homeotic protein proboscipedia-like n=1 Tax=Manduca sexta TaxID=7130 RepID=UPI00188EDF99